ncbi:MAG: type III pantothenate kinase [Burkholderiales bacterium RIFCSPLOWO2_02_FULL_57_36]|nr:MAG: type III pantothenate kinase [Burkholderiales bacterium RIFCSPLOWO2_02_FULL_57_36]
MLLLIDAGNTRIKWALAESESCTSAASGAWIDSGAVGHAEIEQLTDAWHGRKPDRILLSNVAGQVVRENLERILAQTSSAASIELFRSLPEAGGVRNGYRDPGQLGCDRFAAVIGAHALYPEQHLIVATCGTATTIDAVSAEGDFIGGMILPGLGLMAASLARNTAQLPQVAHRSDAVSLFADTTDDAIISGCISAQAGAIERAAAALVLRYGSAQCIISGGAAPMVAPHVSIPCNQVDNLVLIGLQTVAMNQKTSC